MNTFPWDGVQLPYFNHPHNETALNSRRIEIPIVRHHIRKLAQGRGPLRILEVGNVLSNYQDVHWAVIDLYEPGCINADVTTYESPELFDLVISISTIEHIEGDPNEVLTNIRTFLAPGGRAVITAPTKYNKYIDRYLRAGILVADRLAAIRHIGNGEWFPCSVATALEQSRYSCAGRWRGGMVCIYLYKPVK